MIKNELDDLLKLYKAQPVGTGYLDIIVKHENVRGLIETLIGNGFRINRITWWEYVAENENNRLYGFGGPRSHYYVGWFSEFCFGDDEIDTDSIENIMEIIENKEFDLRDGSKITYKQDEFLTPALWLVVPDDWKSS